MTPAAHRQLDSRHKRGYDRQPSHSSGARSWKTATQFPPPRHGRVLSGTALQPSRAGMDLLLQLRQAVQHPRRHRQDLGSATTTSGVLPRYRAAWMLSRRHRVPRRGDLPAKDGVSSTPQRRAWSSADSSIRRGTRGGATAPAKIDPRRLGKRPERLRKWKGQA